MYDPGGNRSRVNRWWFGLSLRCSGRIPHRTWLRCDLAEGLRGASPQQVIQLPSDFYLQMGLQKGLTIQRLNGMSGMVAHIKRLAVEKMTA